MAVAKDEHLPEEVLTVARQVATIVRQTTRNPAYRVFVFGSWASGKARRRSDIDIGIEGPDPVDPPAMFEIREACEALPTLYTLDLIDFARVSPLFRKHATSEIFEVELP